ncbi:hypothetical protein ACFOKI_01375 [Sphingomonas qilianensis]|uniref:Mobilization protein n=1 Tax=Sphingomonas qilianensis TaxID=1736690 RepID=A0ABU9XSF3_9SPHN
MSDERNDRPKRQPRGKRTARDDAGKKIVVRLNDEQWGRLELEAGGRNISEYVRARLFDGNIPKIDRLSLIGALHVVGRRLQLLTAHPATESAEIAATLADVRAAIARLSMRKAGVERQADSDELAA